MSGIQTSSIVLEGGRGVSYYTCTIHEWRRASLALSTACSSAAPRKAGQANHPGQTCRDPGLGGCTPPRSTLVPDGERERERVPACVRISWPAVLERSYFQSRLAILLHTPVALSSSRRQGRPGPGTSTTKSSLESNNWNAGVWLD